jgi:ketosteroid isomerase-like protein
MTTTKDVLDRHLEAFGKGDLPGILADYAPRAVMFTPQGPLEGPAAMRPLFESLIAEFRKPGATFEVEHRYIAGDYAYIVWRGSTSANVYEMATDTFVVRNGRIVAQSFAAKVTARSFSGLAC